MGSALSEASANMRFAGSQKCILQLAFKQLDLLNFRTCGLKTQVFRTRVQDVETRVPRTLSLIVLVLVKASIFGRDLRLGWFKSPFPTAHKSGCRKALHGANYGIQLTMVIWKPK